MLYAWKFVAQIGYPVLGIDGLHYEGQVAVVIAENVDEARQRLRDYAREEGDVSAAWIDAVTPQKLPLNSRTVLVWVQV